MKKRDVAIAAAGGIAAAVAVKMIMRNPTVDWETSAPSVPHSDRSNFVSVDGARIHYQEFGDRNAPTIILIHGYTASVYIWETTAPILADAGFHIIAVDLIGFGYSEKPAWFDYTIASQARMVERLMDRLGIGRAVVVGSSYGGGVAATLALDHPARVEKLVLANAACNDEPLSMPILRLASLPVVGEILAPFLVDSAAFIRLRMRTTLAPENYDLITERRVENIRRPLNAADAHHSVLATARNWDAERIEADAHLIGQPTLIIWGDQDQVVPIHNGYKLRDAILHSQMIVIRDCGHVPMEEATEHFTDLIIKFCRDPKGRIGDAAALSK
jgi:pimeloyl-ACP methyl ester carboxylesterase